MTYFKRFSLFCSSAIKKGVPLSKTAREYQEKNLVKANSYGILSVVTMFLHLACMMKFYGESISVLNISMNVLLCVLYIASYQGLRYLSQVEFIDDDSVCLVGCSSNTTGRMSHHLKDAIILCTVTQLTALLSDYFWLLLLVLPIRVSWLVYYDETFEERRKRKRKFKLRNLGIDDSDEE